MGAEVRWRDVLAYPAQRDLIGSLVEEGDATAADLMRRCHLSEATLRRHLDALVRLGVVREHGGELDGMTPGRPATRYWLDAGVRKAAGELLELLELPVDFSSTNSSAASGPTKGARIT
jgi:predicted ArsR family transcriptional regulator